MDLLDQILPTGAGKTEQDNLLISLADRAGKPFSQRAFDRAVDQLRDRLNDPTPIVKKHGIKMVSEVAVLLASTILFSVLAITVIIIAVLVAVGTLSWAAGLILVIAFVIIIYLSLKSLANCIARYLDLSVTNLKSDLSEHIFAETKALPDHLKEAAKIYVDETRY